LTVGHRIDKFNGTAFIESGSSLAIMQEGTGTEHIVVVDQMVFCEITDEKLFRPGSLLLFSPADFRARKETK